MSTLQAIRAEVANRRNARSGRKELERQLGVEDQRVIREKFVPEPVIEG